MPTEPRNAPTREKPRRAFWRRTGFRVMWYVVIAYVVWCAVLYFYQDRLLFPADLARLEVSRSPPAGAVVTRIELGPGQYV